MAWVAALLGRLRLPQSLDLLSWQPDTLFEVGPRLLLDELAWPFLITLATLALAVVLTDVGRAPEADWSAWAWSLSLAGMGMFAVMAGNPLTLLLAWTLIDLVELLILLPPVQDSSIRERIMVSFSARLGGSVMVIWAMILTRASGVILSFEVIPPAVSLYLLLAAGLRLGVLPLHAPFLQELPMRRGLGTVLRLVPAASSLVLLARVAVVGVAPEVEPYLLALAGLAALYGAAAWLRSADELAGRPFWVLGMAAFALAAAVTGQQAASLVWGVALISSGGLIFLASTRDKRMVPLALLGIWGFSSLPYSPTWVGSLLYADSFAPMIPIFMLAQALLLLGYLRHSLYLTQSLAGVERWVKLIYPLGLALLPLMHLWIGWLVRPGVIQVANPPWWAGVTASGLAGILWFLPARELPFPKVFSAAASVWEAVFSLKWLYRLLGILYRSVGWLLSMVTALLEGEGGLLWTLLLLALLLSLLAQFGGGGGG